MYHFMILSEEIMPKTSTELLHEVERSSLLDGLLLSRKNPTLRTLKSKHHTRGNQNQRPSFTPLPKSQVLENVRDFLQDIAKANKDLEIKTRENPHSNYDIEVLNDEEEYIEMDLLLGVADLHGDDAIAAAEASMSGCKPTVSDSESDDDDDTDEDDESFDEIECRKAYKRPVGRTLNNSESLREKKQNKRPKIVMLD